MMNLLYTPLFLEHDTGEHPENRSRLECLGDLPETDVASGEEYLPLVHSQEYIDKVKEICNAGGGMLDMDTVLSGKSYEVACVAAGAAVAAAEQGDFALARPPGHHAYRARGSGFCLFNNIAVAAQKLLDEGKRVMIFDFDGHLGDGTEDIFYGSDKLLYWSLHQFPAFPGGGWVDQTGQGLGKGFTINVPLPPGAGDDLYFKAIEHLMPVAEKFKPDVVGVSAGFDAHHADPLLQLNLSADAFYRTGVLLREKFPHIFAALEGGYNTEYLPGCIFNFLNGINDEPIHFEEAPTASAPEVVEEFEARLEQLLQSFDLPL